MESLIPLLNTVNETLASGIIIIAASILLYNITRNLKNRVARSSAILLGCVTMAYLSDVFIALGPGARAYEVALRMQWIGIAFMPAAMFHLADALLATTGLPSRGRRKRVLRAMYLMSAGFLLAAAFTNLLVQPVAVRPDVLNGERAVSLRGGVLFPAYVAYFIAAVISAFLFTQRARQRCLTRNTRRRMGYLQFAMLTPALGIFPFSVLLGPGEEFSLIGLMLVNIANIVMILMLLFLAYQLSLFGSDIPDRVVKTELMRFILRGPATGLLVLGTYVITTPAASIFGLPGQSFTPFAIVAVVLMWQWGVALALPHLERRLVYGGDEDAQLEKLQDLSQRLLTRGDLLQLLEAVLAATCDYLRVSTAFAVAPGENGLELVSAVGPTRPTPMLLNDEADALRTLFNNRSPDELHVYGWGAYWLVPLAVDEPSGENGERLTFIGIQARSTGIDLTPDERAVLHTLARRAAQTLEDMALQAEILAALEGLLPQISTTRANAAQVEYRPGRAPVVMLEHPMPDRELFMEQVRAALRHYWGGPGLAESRLLELAIVRDALPEHDNNPSKTLRAILQTAIERQRPAGERKPMSPEWTLYNILEMRFLKGQKVKEVATRLALSEADLYRKQRAAIDAVANTLYGMEEARHASSAPRATAEIPVSPSLPASRP